ncbi:MAG: GNAT family N-acetyltransferase [Chloroflexi bacterium]|nr:GNAT family N-acetyltransferase [Chloroflexota bacterium]
MEDAFGERVVADLADALRTSPDWIEGLSFVAERAGRLIGHILFTRSLLDAPRRLVEVLVLSEGSPTYYRRFGFQPAGEHGFRRPSLRIPEPAFQVIRHPTYEDWMTGTVVYSRVFWDLDCVGLRQ